MGRGQKGLGRAWMLNATSVPGSIANGEYTCKMPLLKFDQPVQKTLDGIATSEELPGMRHFNVKTSATDPSTNIAKNG